MDHLPDLALHHLARLGHEVRIAAAEPDQMKAVHQRRERIPELVRERREELVLAPVRDEKGLLAPAQIFVQMADQVLGVVATPDLRLELRALALQAAARAVERLQDHADEDAQDHRAPQHERDLRRRKRDVPERVRKEEDRPAQAERRGQEAGTEPAHPGRQDHGHHEREVASELKELGSADLHQDQDPDGPENRNEVGEPGAAIHRASMLARVPAASATASTSREGSIGRVKNVW
jgi:hypothetical protein